MAAQHTPGPWMVSKGCDQYVCTDGQWIASTMGTRGAEGAANARVIAAAPELLDCLRELVALVRGECPSLLDEDSGGDARLDLAIDAALAKAEGRS